MNSVSTVLPSICSKYLRTESIQLTSDLNHEDSRKKTFDDNNWNNYYINADILAKIGFYFLKQPDTVKCKFCSIKLSQFEAGDDPIREHMKYSQNCPLMRRRSTANVPINAEDLDSILPPASYDECGIQAMSSMVVDYDEIKYPDFKTELSRIGSYRDWPKSLNQKPKELAEGGFFYTGRGDKVTCFSCGLGLSDWENGDNVWVEHNKFSKNCDFLNMNQDILQENEKLAANQEKKEDIPAKETVEKDTSFGIESCCKICLDARANVVLLPCKHVAVCGKCVFGLKDTCPICRVKITSKMSLFFS